MQQSLIGLLTFGLTLGFSVGIVPGPFIATVISQTLKYNLKEGLKVACSIFITDPIFILVTTFVLSKIADFDFYMGLISLAGAGYLLKMAYENLTIKDTKVDLQDARPQSIRKGLTIVLLTPAAYLFWLTVGAPTIITAYQQHWLGPVAFLGGVYSSFIGTNLTVAWLVSRSAGFLQSSFYQGLIKLMGLAILFFAAVFIKNGLELLGII